MTRPIPERNTLRGAPLWVHAFCWGVCGGFTLLLVGLYVIYRDTDVWMILMDSPLPAKHAFNEALYGSIYRQRANTLSNLGYVLVGLYVIAYAWWDYRRPTKETDPYAVRHPALMVLFGLTCIELGIGSGLMHAAMSSWGHKLDVFGMVSTLAALGAIHWARWLPSIRLGGRQFPTWPLFGLIAAVLSVYLLFNLSRFGSGNAGYAGLIGIACITLALEIAVGKHSQQLRWPLLSLASLALAYYIWTLDRSGQFSSPDSWFQGHAIWHLLTAVSLGSAAVLYRSEVPKKRRGMGAD
ncbi:MAG: hypothetical protein GC168_17800 [Candidatus Hydrogenedens sp.]|nr:hypothetical protein [Candidatus Hydrogenedens sp.]